MTFVGQLQLAHAEWQSAYKAQRVGKRRRRRRKGEHKVKALDTAELLALFECDDVPTLLAKLDSIGVKPYVSLGAGGSTQVFLSDLGSLGNSADRRIVSRGAN